MWFRKRKEKKAAKKAESTPPQNKKQNETKKQRDSDEESYHADECSDSDDDIEALGRKKLRQAFKESKAQNTTKASSSDRRQIKGIELAAVAMAFPDRDRHVQRAYSCQPGPHQPDSGQDANHVNRSYSSGYLVSWAQIFVNRLARFRGFDIRPRMYYGAGHKYHSSSRMFQTQDGMGRREWMQQPFDCTVDNETQEFQPLCTQVPDHLFLEGNSTWDRTVIRSMAPLRLLVASLPWSTLPRARRHGRPQSPSEWLVFLLVWVAASILLLPSRFFPRPKRPNGKDPNAYLPITYKGIRYPRIARNYLENRPSVTAHSHEEMTQSYRSFGPRALCPIDRENPEYRPGDALKTRHLPAVQHIKKNEYHPYIFISYSFDHFERGNKDQRKALIMFAREAAMNYAIMLRKQNIDESQVPTHFWLAHNCQAMKDLDLPDKEARVKQGNEDTYAMSDIVGGASHLVVLAGSPFHKSLEDPVREWGSKVWTMPELVLSQGKYVTVYDCSTGTADPQAEDFGELPPPQVYPKLRLAQRAWPDIDQSRRLIESYSIQPLPRLELVQVAWECIMARRLGVKHAGDRSYALMGLLHVRPPINIEDSSFQAFARLSFPQHSDHLMERHICLLPQEPIAGQPEIPWEETKDQYKSSLWDIDPIAKVCGVGENDTVEVDDCYGAMVQWSMFSPVLTHRRLTLGRKIRYFFVNYAFLFMILGLLVLSSGYAISFSLPLSQGGDPVTASGAILFVVGMICMLASPIFIRHVEGGKFWSIEPCLFGIEGYVPLPFIEEKLFGAVRGCMSWSTAGSPQSQHEEGEEAWEESIRLPAKDDLEIRRKGKYPDGPISTYIPKGIDPLTPCKCPGVRDRLGRRMCLQHETVESVREKEKSEMGKMKVFILVDTLSMTATLFRAVRPPTHLIVCGSEGGMKRTLACSMDIKTGILYRETVLRLHSFAATRMHSLPRLRLGLKRPAELTEPRIYGIARVKEILGSIFSKGKSTGHNPRSFEMRELIHRPTATTSQVRPAHVNHRVHRRNQSSQGAAAIRHLEEGGCRPVTPAGYI